jgi:uncharacterized protein YceH (UPF0502 family)
LGHDPDPLVHRLPRRPGQKEERWAQLLGEETHDPDATSDSDAGNADEVAPRAGSVSLSDEMASLRADVDALREEVRRMGAVVEELRTAFDL